MTNFIKICCLLLLLFSCKENNYNLSEHQIDELIKKTNELYNSDQSAIHQFDSLHKKYQLPKGVSFNMPNFKIKAQLLDKYPAYENEFDSLINVLDYTNSINTNSLITITKAYGYPGLDRFKPKKMKPAYMVFTGAQKEYFNEIKQIIIKEVKAERMSLYEAAYIISHLEGRIYIPPRMHSDGKTIIDINNNPIELDLVEFKWIDKKMDTLDKNQSLFNKKSD